jgi:broad specificity phosphatase PhoE
MDKKNIIKKAMDKMKFGRVNIIARHGSTNSNGDKVFRGWKEVSTNQLTPKGREGAKALGEHLKKEIGSEDPKNYILITSDLNRAIDTAKIVSKETGIPVGKEYKDLRSQDTGDYTGVKEDDVKSQVEKNIEETPERALPGATESHNDFLKRVKQVFKQVPKDYPNKKIIMVLHHQVEVLQANGFNRATETMFQNGLRPGGHRHI